MAIPISSGLVLPVVAPVEPLSTAISGASSANGGEFRAALEGALDRVDQFRAQADRMTQSFLAGEGGDLHNVVLATQEAELTFEVAQQVRNKVVQAYQEVMRMQM